MKTIEIEIAVMEYLNIRRNLIVPNVGLGIANLHECDLLSLSKSNYATEIEIKVSKYDLLKDNAKKHGHVHNHIAQFFFAVPKKLKELALQTIPERAGLLIVEKYKAYFVRHCERNRNAVKWSDQERNDLARLGTMRILGLKKKIAIKK